MNAPILVLIAALAISFSHSCFVNGVTVAPIVLLPVPALSAVALSSDHAGVAALDLLLLLPASLLENQALVTVQAQQRVHGYVGAARDRYVQRQPIAKAAV